MTRSSWHPVLLVAALAAALRLPGLSSRPLSPMEAEAAWQAWRTASGLDPGSVTALLPDSGLLFTLQTWLFGLLGAGDTGVRLLPALAGVALALAPFAFRPWIGRIGALTAAILLAIDPWQIETSRTASGTTLSALLGMLLLACLWRRSTGCVAILAGLFAVSGPDAWSFLPVLLIAGWLRRDDLGLDGRRLRHGLPTAMLIGGLASSALLLRPAGVASLSASLTTWINGWNPAGVFEIGAWARLLLSNPVPLALALAGALLSWSDTGRWRLLLVGWGAWAVLLAATRGDTERIWLNLVMILVGARVGEVLYRSALERRVDRWTAATIVVPTALAAAAWASRLEASRPGPLSVALLVALCAGGLLTASRVGSVYGSRAVALVAIGTLVLAALTALSNPPRSHAGSPSDVRQLVKGVKTLSAHRTGDESSIPLQIQVDVMPDPVLGWYFREMQRVRWVRAPDRPRQTRPPLLITPPSSAPPGTRYSGSRYRIRSAPRDDERAFPDSVVLWVAIR